MNLVETDGTCATAPQPVGAEPANPRATPAPDQPIPIPNGPAFRRITIGQPIAVQSEEIAAMRIDLETIERTTTGQLAARVEGNLRYADGLLSVVPLKVIDPNAGRALFDFNGDVAADQGLTADFDFSCAGDLFVSGPLQPTEMRVGRSILAHGEILGRRMGRITVAQHVASHKIAAAEIIARGEIRVTGDILNSQITCGGRIGAAGQLAGGRVQANRGVTCGQLGDRAKTATVVEVADPRSHALLLTDLKREHDRRRTHVQAFSQKVQPFIAEMKRLSPAQREKATELMSHLAELEEQLETQTTLMSEFRTHLTKHALAEVIVNERAHGGVTLRFGGMLECTLTEAIAGPFKLTLKTDGAAPAIELSRESDGTTITLPSKPIVAGH